MKLKVFIAGLCVLSLLLGLTGSALAMVGTINTNDGNLDSIYGSIPSLISGPDLDAIITGGWYAIDSGFTQFGFRIDTNLDLTADARYFGMMFDCDTSGGVWDGGAADIGLFYLPSTDAVYLAKENVSGNLAFSLVGTASTLGEKVNNGGTANTIEVRIDKGTFEGVYGIGSFNLCTGKDRVAEIGVPGTGRYGKFMVTAAGISAPDDNPSQVELYPPTPVTLVSYGEKAQTAPWLAIASAALLLLAGGLAFWLKRSQQS